MINRLNLVAFKWKKRMLLSSFLSLLSEVIIYLRQFPCQISVLYDFPKQNSSLHKFRLTFLSENCKITSKNKDNQPFKCNGKRDIYFLTGKNLTDASRLERKRYFTLVLLEIFTDGEIQYLRTLSLLQNIFITIEMQNIWLK